jgi:hypothetical protein
LSCSLQLGIGQRLAARGQRGLDGLLGHVDGGAAGLLLFDGQLRHALHQLGHAARLAQKLRLGVFQIGGVAPCANSCVALSTRESNSFISTLENKKG